MDLSESMKIALSKGGGGSIPGSESGSQHSHGSPGAGYVTEKLYMLLQLYLQNKGWNPSVELLQCFSELKDSPVLPSPAYLQVIANRVNLDSQGRLILRENGKIVLPYEHFGNAVMLKHMQGGPHGIHLSVEQTVRAVMDSYTIGRENFGMEKEFIIDVVKSCPSCRYYKNHIGAFMDQNFGPGTSQQISPDYMAHLQQMAAAGIDITTLDAQLAAAAAQGSHSQPSVKHAKPSTSSQIPRIDPQQAQITAAIIQQQNRAMQQAQQNLDKNFASMFPIEKQRQLLQQYEKEHYKAAVQQHQQPSSSSSANTSGGPGPSSTPSLSIHPASSITSSQQGRSATPLTPTNPHNQVPITPQETSTKINDFYRSSLESLESISSSNKDLLALHNGAWSNQQADARISTNGNANNDGMIVGQEKIVRAFTELMRNMARMKTFIRPAMCKPYGKQSESLQKTLMDTIQIVQTLRSYLPAPHIPVSSWKSESSPGMGGSKGQEVGNS